jgi:outer membrane protein assembly factor BamB
MKPRLLLLAPCLMLAGAVHADEWPQWRGRNRDDISKETGLLRTWPKAGPKLLWTFTDAGIGYSGPAVVGDRLYTMGGDGKKTFVYCLDLGSQEKVWSTEVGPFYTNGNGDGPRSTPTVDGPCLYALSGQGDLVCVETATGKVVWKKSLVKDLGGGRPGWGYTESVLVDGDRLLCTPGGSKGAVAALNKNTGDVVWRSKGFTDGAQYASLVIATIGGTRQYVQLTNQGLTGVAADDGRLLWRYRRAHGTAAVPTPVVRGDYVYATSGYGAGSHLVHVVPKGGKFEAKEVYHNGTMVNHHGGVLLVGDCIYGYSDSKGWVCQEFMTGKALWASQKLGKGSVTYADGRLYCYTEGDGTACLIDASPKGWKEEGRFKIPQRSKVKQHGLVWTHPVVANGRLYLRDQDLLFCYDVKAHTTAGAR